MLINNFWDQLVRLIMRSLFWTEMRFHVCKSNIKEWRLYWSLSVLLECSWKNDDDDELFLTNGWPTKGIYPSFQPSLLSKILSIVNLRDATSRISNLSLDLVEWSCALMITTTPRRHSVILMLFTDVILIYLQFEKHDYFCSVSDLFISLLTCFLKP